jgi:hypothetical protein
LSRAAASQDQFSFSNPGPGALTVQGTISGTRYTHYTVQIFHTPLRLDNAVPQGRNLLDTTDVQTDYYGNATFTISISPLAGLTVAPGDLITCTATSPSTQATSPFSNSASVNDVLTRPTPLGPTGTIAPNYLGGVLFSWTAVPGAGQYQLWIKDKDTGVSYHPSSLTTSFQATNLIAGHRYAWEVRASDAGGGISPWSQEQDFQLAALASLSVSDGLAGEVTNPVTFEWNGVSGANTYELSVLDQTTGKMFIDLPNLSNTFLQTTLTAGHSYSWKVRALDASLRPGPWSTPLTLTVVALRTPIPTGPTGETMNADTIVSWELVSGAASYNFQLTDRANPKNPVTASVIGPGLDLGLALGHSYTWQVQAVASDGTKSAWSAGQNLKRVALASPQPQGPLGRIAATTPVFSWVPVPGASRYTVEVDDVTSRARKVLFSDQVTAALFQDPIHPLTPGHRYRWWVQAIDAAGHLSAPSPSQDFGVETLAAPILQPVGAVIPLGGVPPYGTPFNWVAVLGADHYSLWVDDLTTGQRGVLIAPKVQDTHFSAGAPLASGHTYRWRVQAFDHLGNASPWSATISFTES